MDVQPQDINPDIVKIGRTNPLVMQVFNAYALEVPSDSGHPLTWVQALELMVLKLSEQHEGAMVAWKQTADKLEVAVPPKQPLVNENPLLLDGRELKKAPKTGTPCPDCGYDAWIIVDGLRRCGVCEGERRRRNYQMKTQLFHDAIEEAFKNLKIPIPPKVQKLLDVKP